MIGYQPVRLGQVPLRPRILGAEELIELGSPKAPERRSGSVLKLGAPGTGLPDVQTVTISADEAKLMLSVVQNIITFSQDYAIEFQSYCPPDRWSQALSDVGTWNHEIERQVNTGATQIAIPADVVFRLIDLEKCVSYARDARLSGAKWAFGISAAGAIADFLFKISWLGTIAYVTGLSILLGQPLIAKFHPDPQAPYEPLLSGRRRLLGLHRRHMGSQCELIRMKLEEEEKKEPNARKVLERVLVSADVPVERHHWGTVEPRPGGTPGSTCLQKGRFRVRVEGWSGDVVTPAQGWAPVDGADCWGAINIGVYSTDLAPSRVLEAKLNRDSGHERSYWVEYTGPSTGGKTRRAGPFGCTGDPVDHAQEDGGWKEPGKDGGYVIFDESGSVVEAGV